MRQKTSSSGVSTSNWLPLDHNLTPFDAGYGAVVTGPATFNLEYTYDNVFDPTVTPTIFTLVTAQTTTQDGVITKPISAIRINQTAGAGGVVLTVLQGTSGS